MCIRDSYMYRQEMNGAVGDFSVPTYNMFNLATEMCIRDRAMEALSDREKKILSLRFFAGKTQMEVSRCLLYTSNYHMYPGHEQDGMLFDQYAWIDSLVARIRAAYCR